jgi:site-specific DNA-methyltransferase (adenine-specific)
VTNLLIHGDAIALAQHVRPGSAQLAYLDPPFGVGASTGARAREGGTRAKGRPVYRDRWPSVDAYVAWLEPRLAVVRELLGTDGTLWLQLDHRTVHEAKAACDRIFGRRAHLGDIVWATGNGTRGTRKGPNSVRLPAIGGKTTRSAHNK